MLVAGEPANAFLKRLIEAACWDDAIAFIAHALPTRKAVWWACLCARHRAGDRPTPAEKKALLAAMRWVVVPTEAHRKLADEAGRGLKSTASAAARSAPPPTPAAPRARRRTRSRP